MELSKEQAERMFQFYSAISDIVQIFGETELGTCEVDEEAIAKYCCQTKFIADNFNCVTKDDLYQKITNDILSGFAVWEFLKVSDWTKKMLEKSFEDEKALVWEKMRKKFKCYTCKHYKSNETEIGLLEKCTYTDESQVGFRGRSWMRRRDAFEPLKSCKNYSRKR